MPRCCVVVSAATDSPGNSGRRASFGSSTSGFSPPARCSRRCRAPSSRCARSRFSSVTTSAASGATARRSAAAVGYDALYCVTPAPSSSPTSATSTSPSPSPEIINVRRADSARTIGVGSLDRVHHDRVEERLVGGRGEVDLVFFTRAGRRFQRRHRGRRRAEHRRSAETGDLLEDAVELARRHEVVALVLDVVAQHDGADPHAAQHARRRPAGSATPSWKRRSKRVQQIGGAGRAVRDQLARDVRPVHEAGRDRVDGVAPRVRGEVGARLLEHARRVALRVEILRRLRPVRRHLLGPLEVLAVEAAVEQRGQVHHDQQHHHADHRGADQRTSAPAQRVDAHVQPETEHHREREHDQRHRARGAAQREAGARAVGERLEDRAERRRVRVRRGADRDDHADDEQRDEEEAGAASAPRPPRAGSARRARSRR